MLQLYAGIRLDKELEDDLSNKVVVITGSAFISFFQKYDVGLYKFYHYKLGITCSKTKIRKLCYNSKLIIISCFFASLCTKDLLTI